MKYTKARFEITSKCDLACTHCYRLSYWKWTLWRDLSTEEVIATIDYLAQNWLKKIKLLWWEFFVRWDYLQILEHLKEKWVSTFLISNWLAISEEVINKIRDMNISLLSISIEWPHEINNAIRWYNLDYDKLVINITNAAKHLPVCISTTIQKENIDYIEDIYKLFENKWIKYIHFPVFMARTKEEIDQTQDILWEDIKMLPYNWENYFTQNDYIGKNLEILEKVKEFKQKYWIDYLITPIMNDSRIPDLYTKKLRKSAKLDCTFLKQPVINNNWDVHFCPFMRIKLWNIKENSLNNIYSSERYKNLLNLTYKNNLLPVCERCCWLEISE